jgi:nucleotide-binding universal stress UspA family protein
VPTIARILVPLDGSEFAEQALPRAAALAAHHGAELLLVQALDLVSARAALDPMEAPLVPPPAAIRKSVESYLQHQGRDARGLGAPAVRELVLDGPPVEAIARVVAAEAVDLVVLTTHGRGAVGRMFLGGVAHGLLHRLTVPLLLLRPGAAPHPASGFRRVLLPVDQTGFSEQALATAERVTAGMPSELTVLSVVTAWPTTGFEADAGVVAGLYEELTARELREREVYVGQVAAELRARGHAVVRGRIELGGSVAGTILDVAEELDADLIAIATHGARGARGLMLGSVADKVVRAARCAVLVQRPVAAASSGR